MFYMDPDKEFKTVSASIIMCDLNDRRDSEGLSDHLKRTVVMSICRPNAFQYHWTIFLYTFTWIEAKKCAVFRSLNGFQTIFVALVYWL